MGFAGRYRRDCLHWYFGRTRLTNRPQARTAFISDAARYRPQPHHCDPKFSDYGGRTQNCAAYRSYIAISELWGQLTIGDFCDYWAALTIISVGKLDDEFHT